MSRHAKDSQLEQMLRFDTDGHYIAPFGQFQLTSVFQPIYYRRGDLFGHEALLRVTDTHGKVIRPEAFFAGLPLRERIEADRLSRLMHVHNYTLGGERGCLCLNTLPLTLVYEASFTGQLAALRQRLGDLGMEEGMVLLECTEYDIEAGEPRLPAVLQQASDHDFGVIVDNYGTLASGHRHVRELCPDIIKLDASLLADHMHGDGGRLRAVLDMGWEMGARMLMQGIEKAAQLQAMQELGVELYQGHYLGHPAPLTRHEEEH